MLKKILISSSVVLLLLTGCATNEGPEYDGKTHKKIKRFEIGTVLENNPVVIKDDGSGSLFGIIIGAVVGSTFGSGAGSTVASLAGGIGGHYAGKEAGKANGAELSIRLDNGDNIIVVVEGEGFEVGEKIKIILSGNKVEQIKKVDEVIGEAK